MLALFAILTLHPMRGVPEQQAEMFSYLSPDARVPRAHPLRSIKAWADRALAGMSASFDAIYSHTGRPSIAPEVLLKSQLLMAFHSIRSERLFCEMLEYNLLYRWLLDMGADDRVFDPTVFTKNRDRLLAHEVAKGFLAAVVEQARGEGLLSDEHFSVDGTLIEAWASMKRFQAKDEAQRKPPADDDRSNPTYDFKGEKRSNATHESLTDPDCQLYRKSDGAASQLCYLGHTLMENRNGFLVDTELTRASGTAEVEAAETLIGRELQRQGLVQTEAPLPAGQTEAGAETSILTLGADKNYHQKALVQRLIEMKVQPHFALKAGIHTPGLDEALASSEGYKRSIKIRKRIEEGFGWIKMWGGLYKVKVRGLAKVGMHFALWASAYNLVRLGRLRPLVG